MKSDSPFHRVGRTLNQEAMSEAMLLTLVDQIVDKLRVGKQENVLDLCCGNGLITVEVAKHCRSLVAVDFSETLIEDLRGRSPDNVTTKVANALEARFASGQFDRVLIAAAIQHFSRSEIITLFDHIYNWLTPSGILMVTDIPDSQCMWEFYDNEERENLYFESVKNGTPILGTWLERSWLTKLARHVGFEAATPLSQPEGYWYGHYRFDLVCCKEEEK